MNEKILSYIKANPWQTSFQIASGVRGDKNDVRSTIKELIVSGAVQKAGKAKGTRYALAEAESIDLQTPKAPSEIPGIVEFIASAAGAGRSMKDLTKKFSTQSNVLLPLLKLKAADDEIAIRGKVRWTRYYTPEWAPPEKPSKPNKKTPSKKVGKPKTTPTKPKVNKIIRSEVVSAPSSSDWDDDGWFDRPPAPKLEPKPTPSPKEIFERAFNALKPGKRFDPYQFGAKLAASYDICSVEINDLIFGDSQTRKGGALRDGRLEYEMVHEPNGNRLMAWKPTTNKKDE